jgi:AraC-like DNA-binding protein
MTLGLAEAFRIAGAAVALLLGTALLRDHPKDQSARAAAFLLAGVVAHLLLPIAMKAGAPIVVLRAGLLLAVSVPVAFWLLAQIHFDDDFRLTSAHWALVGVTCGIGYLSWLAIVEKSIPGRWFGPAQRDFWDAAPKLLMLAIVVHALFRVYVGAGSDLLLPRLRLRYGLLLIAGLYMLIELLGELVLRGSPSERLADTLHGGLVLALVFGSALAAMRTSSEVLRPARATPEGPVTDPLLVGRLKKVMEAEAAFRQEGLTIRLLAERMGTQEHKLRQLINAELGFKNFNAFLHHYRIREAQQALSDPAKAHLGIAQIAYEVGYRSLATFNKAFKDATGRTPTELRGTR